jgi:hypothetical protein
MVRQPGRAKVWRWTSQTGYEYSDRNDTRRHSVGVDCAEVLFIRRRSIAAVGGCHRQQVAIAKYE